MAGEWQPDRDGSPTSVLTMTARCLSVGIAAALTIALALFVIVLLLTPIVGSAQNNVHEANAQLAITLFSVTNLHASHR